MTVFILLFTEQFTLLDLYIIVISYGYCNCSMYIKVTVTHQLTRGTIIHSWFSYLARDYTKRQMFVMSE